MELEYLMYFLNPNQTGGKKMKQEFFDTLNFKSRADAIKAKNARAKELRNQGHRVLSSILKNQLRKYTGLGQPDGSIRDVFMITIV